MSPEFAEIVDETFTATTLTVAGKVVLAIFIAIALQYFIKAALRRLHRRFQGQGKIWKDSFVKALYQPLALFIWLYAIFYIINTITHTLFATHFFDSLPIFLGVGAVISACWFFLRWNHNVVSTLTEKSKRGEVKIDQGKVDAIGKLLTILILFITAMLLLEVTGQSVQTLIAVGGVGGLAVAIASQEIIANFFGGLMIYITQPFSVGDWVNLPEKNLEGHIEEIGWYMTQMRSFDKRPIYVPNSIFTRLIVITPSRMSHRQIKEVISLRYQDLVNFKEIIHDLKEMLLKHPSIDKDLATLVHFSAFGEFSVDITISTYTKTITSERFADVKQDVLLKIADILALHGAEFASPSQVLTIPNVINLKNT